ncbi:MAG: M23 family metallopeptidase [Candidatus Methylomirabilis sp.]|nr:M23 family metallopeptidase [Deltaproteobacteria bacterium]
MARIRSFNTKLKVLANLQFTEQRETEFLQGVGGPAADQASLLQLLDENIEEQTRKMRLQLEDIYLEARIQREAIAELKDFLATKSSLLASTPSIWPVSGWVSSYYGPRVSSFGERWEFHRGLDIAARTGNVIVAPADGVVVLAERYGGYGNLVVIDHGYETVTRYGHLSKFLTKAGARVKRGDSIGEVGSTGRSTGPHLHYEVRLAGKPVDPQRYILN